MIFDQLSQWISVASVIVGLLTVVIVGSQDIEDARSIRSWTLIVLLPMLVASSAWFAVIGQSEGIGGGLGMVVLFSSQIASVFLGFRIATSRDRALQLSSHEKKPKLPHWDDELA